MTKRPLGLWRVMEERRAAIEVFFRHYRFNGRGKPQLSRQPFSAALSRSVNQRLANGATHTCWHKSSGQKGSSTTVAIPVVTGYIVPSDKNSLSLFHCCVGATLRIMLTGLQRLWVILGGLSLHSLVLRFGPFEHLRRCRADGR